MAKCTQHGKLLELQLGATMAGTDESRHYETSLHWQPQTRRENCYLRLTHRADGTHDYTEVDADFWGGSGNVKGDTMAQPQCITSSTTAKGAVPTQGVTMDHVYAAVDHSKNTSRKV